eukprot:1602516-Prymnesium_polylepis.1
MTGSGRGTENGCACSRAERRAGARCARARASVYSFRAACGGGYDIRIGVCRASAAHVLGFERLMSSTTR